MEYNGDCSTYLADLKGEDPRRSGWATGVRWGSGRAAILWGLGVNIGLDVDTDVHLLVRWVAAIAVGLLVLAVGRRFVLDRTDD